MKYLFDNKYYDTEKAKKIIDYVKAIEHKGTVTTYPRYKHTLYKSEKGQFFVHVGESLSKFIVYPDYDYIYLIPKEKAKEILVKLNEIELYEELFGVVEEG